jgi:hypothetical protein
VLFEFLQAAQLCPQLVQFGSDVEDQIKNGAGNYDRLQDAKTTIRDHDDQKEQR